MERKDLVKDIRKKVKSVIVSNNMIKESETVIVGVSGGPDSMCLLDILLNLREEIKFEIIVAHVNHMIRDEAESDKKFVEDFCKQKDIKFFCKNVDVKELAIKLHISEETCGRNERYGFFSELAQNTNSSKIAVAHNLDDDVETIMLNMIRGCGLKGITGMSYINGKIIRPLLDIEKKDILEYNILQELNPRFDYTNDLDIYSRNKIRLKLIPMIESEYNPNIKESIIRMKHILDLEEDFLNSYTKKVVNLSIIDNNSSSIIFDFSKFINEHEAIKRRCIREIIYMRLGNTDGVESIHIMDIMKLLDKGITKKKYILGSKFKIEIIKKNIAVIY